MQDIASLLKQAVAEDGAGLDRIDAEHLLAHCLQQTRAWLYAHADQAVDATQADAYAGLVKRRMGGEPVAYLTGVRGFWSLELQVSPDTLVPRPETELLVELALGRLPAEAAVQVLDLGTGSGAIALAIASERPLARITGVDASSAALAVAAGNGRRLGLANAVFEPGDWYGGLDGRRYDVIVSNPPYIAVGDPHLDEGDLRFEPPAALSSGPDGLDAIRTIVAGAPAHLAPGGYLLLEHGWTQGAAVRGLLAEAGFGAIETARDLEERERVSIGKMP